MQLRVVEKELHIEVREMKKDTEKDKKREAEAQETDSDKERVYIERTEDNREESKKDKTSQIFFS